MNELLRKTLVATRVQAKKSQEYMALELEVARKTIQNWEKGVTEPTLTQVVKWFNVLELSAVPYLLQLSDPDIEGIKGEDNEIVLRPALLAMLKDIPEEGMRQLLYLFYGDHGSSPRAVLNMVTAHLQTPMKDRVTQGSVILKNYEMAAKKGMLTSNEHVQPNIELLKDAIDKGEQAAVENARSYVKGSHN